MTDQNRAQARTLFDAGVRAADPAAAVTRALNALAMPTIDGKTHVIAIGKAARGMAAAALAKLSPDETLVVTNPENAQPLHGATVMSGDHPVPGDNSAMAGRAVIALLENMRPQDHILALISGGGSALVVAPLPGLSLADKAQTNQILLASGLGITAMNMVRQNLSRLKGGGFLAMAAPATVAALILSDVVGDDLRAVASGPTTAPLGSNAEARAALKSATCWDRLPEAVKQALSRENTVDYDAARVSNHLIGSNAQSVAAMAAAAPEAKTHAHPLTGDVQDAALNISECTSPGTWLFGGETTVRLAGRGQGGRNQELALRVAMIAEQQGWTPGWVFLSGGTDGRDGPTDAAGGVVDAGTLGRMRAGGIDPAQALNYNDSYPALKSSGDLLITGPTGTNVADLQVLIRP